MIKNMKKPEENRMKEMLGSRFKFSEASSLGELCKSLITLPNKNVLCFQGSVLIYSPQYGALKDKIDSGKDITKKQLSARGHIAIFNLLGRYERLDKRGSRHFCICLKDDPLKFDLMLHTNVSLIERIYVGPVDPSYVRLPIVNLGTSSEARLYLD